MATLAQYAIGSVVVAHGWVHFGYVASSQGWLGPGEGWGWNGHSWLLSGVLKEQSILDLASVFFGLIALGFTVGAIGYVFSQAWWGVVLVGTSLLSTLLYLVMWDGQFTSLPEKGPLEYSSTPQSSSGSSF